MKKFLLALSIFVSANISLSQVVLYETFEDYKNQKNGINFKEPGKITYVKIHFIKMDGKKTAMDYDEFWGFTYKNGLYRSAPIKRQESNVARLIIVGKFCYYENGEAHLDAIKRNVSGGNYSSGHSKYISHGVNGEICGILNYGLDSVYERRLKRTEEQDSSLAPLCDCLLKSGNREVFPCVEKLNKK